MPFPEHSDFSAHKGLVEWLQEGKWTQAFTSATIARAHHLPVSKENWYQDNHSMTLNAKVRGSNGKSMMS